MRVLIGMAGLLASAAPALAGNIDCNGYRYGMQVRDLVTLDVNDGKLPMCEIPYGSKASSQIKRWCNDDDFCTFRAHVSRQIGNRFIIDQILGPVSWGD